MKNRMFIVVTILIAIVVVILIIWALFFRPQAAPSVSLLSPSPFADAVDTGSANTVTSPATFSVNFYKWYIANIEATSSFPTTDQLQNSFTQWLTPSYILSYQSTMSDPNNDADPILFAQDDPRGWGSGITGTTLSQTDTTASTQVVIGSGSGAHTFTLQLVKSNGQWLINSIAGTY